jgi:CheY-like chemotaxis protein
MPTIDKLLHILMVDDDADDRYLTQTAFEENDIQCQMQFVDDGNEVLNFLNTQQQNGPASGKLPHLILLDLNMPKKNGWQVLDEIKKSPEFKHIPVVIFTTSKSPEHVRQSYHLGASSFITKPSSFNNLVEITKIIGQYWVDAATVS